jgi:hypothetical protein
MRDRRCLFILLSHVLIGALAPFASEPLRAEEPRNPLRLPMQPVVERGGQPTPADPAMRPAYDPFDAAPQPQFLRQALAAEEQPIEPPTVVPRQFGDAELLPAPAEGYGPPPGAEHGMLLDESLFDAYGDDGWPHHMVHRWFDTPWFSHSDPNDPYRHVGLGQPLIGTSWRNRPWYSGTFVGGILMEDLIDNRVNQNDTAFMGFRLGFDFDHYWAMEGRWAFAAPELTDGQGVPIDDSSRNYYADVSLVHYPWGDSRWRPYVLAGLGFQTFRFNDENGQRISESPLGIPIGIGVKYYAGPWFTLRFDAVDNIAVGNDHVSAMSNVSLMAGCELRFGGRRQSYFPWHNNTSYW